VILKLDARLRIGDKTIVPGKQGCYENFRWTNFHVYRVQQKQGDWCWLVDRENRPCGWALRNQIVLRDEAEAYYSSVINARPKDARAYLCRGTVRFLDEKLDPALRDLGVAIKHDPRNADAFNERSRVWEQKKDLAKALADIDAAVRLAPGTAGLYLNRALIQQKLKHVKQAVADIDTALRIDPSEYWLMVGRLFVAGGVTDREKSLTAAKELLLREPDDSPGSHPLSCAVMILSPDLDQASAFFERDLRRHPRRGSAWSMLAGIRVMRKQFDEAITEASKALAIEPRSTDILLVRAFALMGKGKYEEGLADCEEAIRIDPQCWRAYRCQITGYGEMKDYTRALAALDKAISIVKASGVVKDTLPSLTISFRHDPRKGDLVSFSNPGGLDQEGLERNKDKAELHFARAKVYQSQGKLDKALADFEESIRDEPDNTEYLLGRALILVAKNEHDKAIDDCNRAIELDPKNSDAFCKRALAWKGKDDPEMALADFEEAIRNGPDNANCFLGRALIFSEKKEYDRALADCNRAVAINPKNSDALFERAQIWESKGDISKALADFDEILKLDPQCLRALALRSQVHVAGGDREAGLADLGEMIRIDPLCFEAYMFRAGVHLDSQDYKRALVDSTEVIRILNLSTPPHTIVPDSFEELHSKVEAYAQRALVYLALGDSDKLLEDLDEYVRNGGEDPTWLQNRGEILLGKKEYAKALVDLNNVIRLNPKKASAIWLRALVYVGMKDWDRALVDINRTGELQPQYYCGPWFKQRALVFEMKKEYVRAKEDLQRSIGLNSTDADAIVDLGDFYYRREEYGKALEEYEHATGVQPKSAVAYQKIFQLCSACPDAKYRDPVRADKAARLAKDLLRKEMDPGFTPAMGKYLDGSEGNTPAVP